MKLRSLSKNTSEMIDTYEKCYWTMLLFMVARKIENRLNNNWCDETNRTQWAHYEQNVERQPRTAFDLSATRLRDERFRLALSVEWFPIASDFHI